MLARTLLIAVAGLAISGCSSLSEFGSLRKESLRNDQGHVIGYKEMLRNERTGEVMAQMALFTPMRGERGEVVGYEEQSRDGGSAVIRGLDGRAIGSRWSDLRSRSTNGKSRGITVVFLPADAKVAAVQPKIHELMASLSASELRRIQ